jgi:hypothetical protein
VEVIIHGTGLTRQLQRVARVVWYGADEAGYRTGLRFDQPLSYAELQAAPPRLLR